MIAVTTFPRWGWDVYAEHCIKSWIKAWPGSVLAYFEGDAPPTRMPGVEFRPLDEIESRTAFLSSHIPEPSSYLFDAKRFCHKVFAQLDALKEHDRMWWLDADVEAIRHIPEQVIENLTNKDVLAYLGRDTYTETGVIGFRRAEGFDEFERKYAECYGPDRSLLKLRYWTDCHAFDYARAGMGFNLTPDGFGVSNVLEDSVLSPYLIHHKGNRKLRMDRRSA